MPMMGELDPQQCDRLLRTEKIARLGVHARGRTHVVPISYAFDGETIVVHSLGGLKIDLMRENPRVCLEVDQITNLVNWSSVVVQGTFEELHGAEASRALLRCAERLLPAPAPPRSGDPFVPPALWPHVVMFRVRLGEVTGRFMEG